MMITIPSPRSVKTSALLLIMVVLTLIGFMAPTSRAAVIFPQPGEGNSNCSTQIYGLDRGTGLYKLLTDKTVGENYNPQVSPDGSRILFSRQLGTNYDIWVMDSTGLNEIQLTFTGRAGSASWSRDGRSIYFSGNNSAGTSSQIVRMNADGTNMVELTSGAGYRYEPRESPDGSKILFTEDINRTGGKFIVMNTNGTNRVQIPISATYYSAPRWLTSSRIVYILADINTLSGNLHAVNIDGTGDTTLTNMPDQITQPEVSPNGGEILYSYQGELYRMAADGSITTRVGYGRSGSWNPDVLGGIGAINDDHCSQTQYWYCGGSTSTAYGIFELRQRSYTPDTVVFSTTVELPVNPNAAHVKPVLIDYSTARADSNLIYIPGTATGGGLPHWENANGLPTGVYSATFRIINPKLDDLWPVITLTDSQFAPHSFNAWCGRITSVVSGTVTGVDGNPAKSVKVLIRGRSGYEKFAYTDSNGHYEIPNVTRRGDYVLSTPDNRAVESPRALHISLEAEDMPGQDFTLTEQTATPAPHVQFIVPSHNGGTFTTFSSPEAAALSFGGIGDTFVYTLTVDTEQTPILTGTVKFDPIAFYDHTVCVFGENVNGTCKGWPTSLQRFEPTSYSLEVTAFVGASYNANVRSVGRAAMMKTMFVKPNPVDPDPIDPNPGMNNWAFLPLIIK